MKIRPSEALAKLSNESSPFLKLYEHGSLQVEIYKPENVDLQQPHSRDEIYVVISGSGEFQNGDTKTSFEAGDFLFVKAGVAHRFRNFTEDFSTWVFFYGPEGGEKA